MPSADSVTPPKHGHDAPAREAILDASAAPIHPAAGLALTEALTLLGADPGGWSHGAARARATLEHARAALADGLGVRPDELTFHPSGAAALTVGIEGLLHARRRIGDRLLASAVERSLVLLRPQVRAPVAVGATGAVDPDRYAGELTPDLAAAVLQDFNGEVGTAQPVDEVAAACREQGVPLLVDATSSFGRVGPPRSGDVLVADARTFGGPPLGLLAVRGATRWSRPGPRPEVERGRELATPWIPVVAATVAAWAATSTDGDEPGQAHDLVTRIRAAATGIPDTDVLGDPDARLPHVVTFSVLYADGEAILRELGRRGFAAASGSSCTSSRLEPSHVLAAMGALTHGNVRIVLPLRAVSPERDREVDRFCAELADVVDTVRREAGVADL